MSKIPHKFLSLHFYYIFLARKSGALLIDIDTRNAFCYCGFVSAAVAVIITSRNDNTSAAPREKNGMYCIRTVHGNYIAHLHLAFVSFQNSLANKQIAIIRNI